MSASLWVRAGLRGGASLRFGPIDSREQSCAEGSPRSGGGCAVAALPGSHRPLPSPPPLLPIAASRLRVKPRPSSGSPVGGTAGRVAGMVQGWCHTVHRVPSALFFRAISPDSGHKNPLNRPLRGLPGVVGRFRRVVVSRRCTQHHLRRVMVETPPRAGPSPPHGPARFFMPAFRPAAGRYPAARRRTLPRRSPPEAAPPLAAGGCPAARRRRLPRRPPPAARRPPPAARRPPPAAGRRTLPSAGRQPPAASRPPAASKPSPVPPGPAADPVRATPFVMLRPPGSACCCDRTNGVPPQHS